jgi:hypothetical protein
MSACFYPQLASIPCDFATGYRRLPGFRPGDNPEVISSPVGLVPTNAFAMSYSRVVGKPEVIIGPDMFGGQGVNAFYIASVYLN